MTRHLHLNRAHHFMKKHGELHVVTTCFNPQRFISRLTLLREFADRVVSSGAHLHVAEVAFGDRPFELDDLGPDVNIIQYRSPHELWLKESVINSMVSRLPHDWKYLAWIDADVSFSNPHWVQETIQQLQHYPLVQMFHTSMDLTADHKPIDSYMSFIASVEEHGFPKGNVAKKRDEQGNHVGGEESGYYYLELPPTYGHRPKGLYHPGYAWAARRDGWDAMGGLLDINIVGGGDLQMAYGLYGHADQAIFTQAKASYYKSVMDWQSHALTLTQNVGYVPGTLFHHWHGSKTKRGYFDRWQILRDNNYDPFTDLKRDWQGIWQLAGNKPKLRDALRKYLHSRQEDYLE